MTRIRECVGVSPALPVGLAIAVSPDIGIIPKKDAYVIERNLEKKLKKN